MAIYGYARVSTIDQDLSLQRRMLKAAGCDVIRAETASGTRRNGRTELQVLLDFLQPGDTLVVTRVDRLAQPCCMDQGCGRNAPDPVQAAVLHGSGVRAQCPRPR